MTSEELVRRLQNIRLVVSDVDGVLASGIFITEDGREIKRFCEKDRPRIDMVTRVGLNFVMISGRDSGATRARAEEMGVDFYPRKHMGLTPASQLLWLQKMHGVTTDQILYIGDDAGDLYWMERVGVAAAPSDAEEECLKRAHLVATAKGGHGAVSEILVRLLRAQGLYERALAPLLE